MINNINYGLLADNFRESFIESDRNGIIPGDFNLFMAEEGIYDTIFSLSSDNIGYILELSEKLSAICAGAASLFTVNSAGLYPMIKFMKNSIRDTLTGDSVYRNKLTGYALSGMDNREYHKDELIRYERTGDDYRLSGSVNALLMGAQSSGFVVLACEDSDETEVTAFYVRSDLVGVNFSEKKELLGLKALPVCSVELDSCVLQADNIVGEVDGGREVVDASEAFARMLSSAQCLGIIKCGLKHAGEFSKNRKQFGKYIGDFQALQDMMTEMQLNYFAGNSMMEKILGSFFLGDKNLRINCAMLKLFAGSSAMKAATDSVQIFGGYGFMRDYPVEKLMRDAKTLEVFFGTAHHLRRILAGNL